MLEYSEYKSLMDVLDNSKLDDTYKQLMKKEEKVLDTVNAVVNHYKDKQYKKNMVMHMSLEELYKLFFLEWPMMLAELQKVDSIESFLKVVLKNNRPFYIGAACVLTAVFLFFVDSS